MSKRFIDTNLFDDPWFMELSPSAKLLWIYSLTKCNHAGIFELNSKLCVFQTGITKSLATVRQEIGNRWTTLVCGKIFIPSFISFQYPKGLHDNVLAQRSVIRELIKYGLWNEEAQTVRQEIGNSSPTVKDMDIYKDKDIEKGNTINTKAIIKGEFVLPEWVPKEVWNDYLEMRKKIKKPMTSAAKKLAVKKLQLLTDFPSNGEAIQIATKILNQSVFHNWQGLFPLKENEDDNRQGTDETSQTQSGTRSGRKNNTTDKKDSKFHGLDEKKYGDGAINQ